MAQTTSQIPDQGNGDIAVVGYSFRLPQDVNDDLSFWDVLENRRNLMTSWPESRMNAQSFLDTKPDKPFPKGAHFITEDIASFDAPFFSVTAKEAAAMDPMQRLTLEASYRAFEKAGFPTESLKGSQTAVFHASMLEDYARLTAMDPDNAERTAITGGTVSCVIPNRVSWYFDLRGPSVHVNTACSSSLVAVDMACKTLRSGDASCALVTGANLLLDPAIFHLLSSQNFLSPDSRCYSFDHRASGYARGEGIVAVVLKPIAAAVRDGDMIRAVIRATGSNQDGYTPILTQPSQNAQQELIEHVYKQAKLPLTETRYVEAHGTGTPVGDPIEARAIGRVFRKYRSEKEPLYIGSVKSNIGHLEGASGLAGLLKVVLSLERGVIPPNALFEKINPAIDADFWHISIPTASVFWPSQGLRRASVNSFGFGGSNTHVVIDDALHYLRERDLPGNHCTVTIPKNVVGKLVSPQSPIIDGPLEDFSDSELSVDSEKTANTKASSQSSTTERLPKLLVWSAADEQATKRSIHDYELFYNEKIVGDRVKLDRLAYTLAARRTHMLWRSFSIIGNDQDGKTGLDTAKPMRSSADATLAFVFTGQGAQYTGMGWDLVKYPVFSDTLQRIDKIYESLGCSWSIFDELRSSKNIDLPQYSQPLSTAVQIALLELLASFGIAPKAVVGHSSGEIAAAYAIGALSLESACKVSYFRGQLAGKLKANNASSPGAMMSINLTEANVPEYLAAIGDEVSSVCIACMNSPLNCTLSGPEPAIDAIKAQADKDGIFAQKLKTGVAYHSPAMEAIAEEYITRMGSLEGASRQDLKVASAIPMVSSVSGKIVRPATLKTGQYWVNNMVSPVRFTDAVQLLTQEPSKVKIGLSNITDLVEIGSHPALRRVAQDTIRQTGNKKQSIRYHAALQRSHPPIQTTLELVGQLFCLGHSVSISAVNQESGVESKELARKPTFLVDTPDYPFDRSQKYWAESRISRDYRLRGKVNGDFLGARASDWNPLAPRWRNFLSVETLPWAGHHKISDTALYPAAGMLVMAIEAVQQMVPSDREVSGFLVKQADFISPILVQETWEDRTETQVHLRSVDLQKNHNKDNSLEFEVDIFSYTRESWVKCFSASIHVDYNESTSIERRQLSDTKIRKRFSQAEESCVWPVDSAVLYRDAADVGLQYGDWFQLVQDARWDAKATAVASVDVSKDRYKTNSLVHPAVLDQAFHVLRVSSGQQFAANVPIRLMDAWFASSPKWQTPDTGSIRWISTSTSAVAFEDAQGHGERGTLAALADDGTVLCTIEQAITAAVSNETASKDKKLLYSTEWKPQISLLEPQQLSLVCKADPSERDETTVVRNHAKICSALDLVSVRVLQRLDRAKIPDALARHVEWMEHHVSNMTPEDRLLGEYISDEDLEARLIEVEEVLPAWKLYTTCARKLPQILTGEIDPLQVVFESDQAEIFYADLFQKLCQDGRLGTILDLVSHETPAQRILEVGAGTGGMTGHVLSLLQQREERTGGSSFAEYTYTDISPMFFERAGDRWPHLKAQGRLTFKTFNLDKPIEDQGFQTGSYDIVVAASVLHATPYLEATVRNVRRALKPGGRLILLEVINPDDIATNFMAGLVPGWWVAREEWRPHSAAVPEHLWDKCLRDNGFSGNDVVLRDYKSDSCHIMSILISTAVEEPKLAPEVNSGKLVIVVDEQKSYRQTRLAELVQKELDPEGTKSLSICAFTLDELSQSLSDVTPDDVVVCIAEVHNQPLLSKLSEESFKCLQYLVGNTTKLLWATASTIDSEDYASYGTMQGFFRAIRAEQADSHIISLSIEGKVDSLKTAQFIAKTFRASFESLSSKELEYLVRDGLLMTGRAIEDVSGNEKLASLSSRQLQHKAWYDGPALQLSIGTHGALDTLRFVRDTKHDVDLGPNEVEVDAKAWGLSQKDLQTVMDRQDFHHGLQLGAECAGIVTRVGRDCDGSIKIGDRVCMVAPGCMRQYPRGNEKTVYKIPEAMSFEATTSMLIPSMTAYHALINVGRLEREEKVIIHTAASAVGQAAVRIAQMQGAEIIATFSTPLERGALSKTMGLSEDHILDSASIDFTQAVMQLTGEDGVDVVFNQLAGEDVVRASYECLAAGGRFLDISRHTREANSALSINTFDRNTSFSVIDVLDLNARTIGGLMKKSVELMEQGHVQPPQLQCFNASEVEGAFQALQNSDISGRVIIKPQAEDVVPKFIQEQQSWKFDANASYMIAGGSGGLGRAIAKWMVDNGAKNLIIPSRSGAASKAAQEVVEELTARGVKIVTPRCDVASETDLSDALDECCRTMPPIKGCINAAMVLQDAVFQSSMTFEQWNLTMRSKAQTSWNLHRFLPKDLDFFIMLSSIAGVIGQMASANYSGGCTYQDALVRYRLAHGQSALSLDIGWMRNVGIVAENSAYQRQRQSLEDMKQIEDTELLAALTMYCDPNSPLSQTVAQAKGQVLLGLNTPADLLGKGRSPPQLLDRPLFAPFSFIADSGAAAANGANSNGEAAAGVRFKRTSDSGERGEIVLRALAARLARAMSISSDDVESNKTLSHYGVDSLMSVDLRNWLGREFGATLSVFEIMGGSSIAKIVDLVVERSVAGEK
ncbi:Compactin diketide synthase mokB [Trichoderma lentiforme]|uniref:Compactin diketide synthase mokB n=1 Tax=Trichoderma lentiforme TaxID=1567552 RepID=A0A9P5CGT1_9HYPO|nr:Compactin diketide synthase mokB [Trichoderma lentiforme]